MKTKELLDLKFKAHSAFYSLRLSINSHPSAHFDIETFFTAWVPENLLLKSELVTLHEYRIAIGKEIFLEELISCLLSSNRFFKDTLGILRILPAKPTPAQAHWYVDKP